MVEMTTRYGAFLRHVSGADGCGSHQNRAAARQQTKPLGTSPFFPHSQGKVSVQLDLSTDAGRDALDFLLKTADVPSIP